jgi:glycine betaine/proline transport system ATP-binding protein
MSDDIVIEARNLFKVFGSNPEKAFPLIEQGLSKEEILEKTGCVVAINDANFQIRRGEMFVVMGLSGSGKSTVIRCLNRLIDPTRGQILVDDKDICELDGEHLRDIRRKKMSMVFQHFGLLPQRSVLRNVEFGLEISGVPPEKRRDKAQAALDLVGLKGYEASTPDELSGGMQQRVGLARALANDPEVLLMDEAFSALDPLIRTQMQDELLDLQDKMHKTVVFITHDLDEALKIGDRIAIMGPGGGVRQIGTPEEILTDPADDYVAEFVENVDRTKVISAQALMKKAYPVVSPKDGPSVAVRRMEQTGHSTVFVTDQNRFLRGLVHIDDAVKARKQTGLEGILREDEIYTTWPETPLAELLGQAMTSRYPMAVVDREGRLLGTLDRATVLAEVGVESDQVQSLTDLQQSQNGDGAPASTATEEKEG